MSTGEAVELARLAASNVDEDEYPGEPAFCLRCNVHVVTDPELEPSPMCNPCAQDASRILGVALLTLAAEVDRMRVVVAAAKEWQSTRDIMDADVISSVDRNARTDADLRRSYYAACEALTTALRAEVK